MSSFYCMFCNTAILDSPNWYITFCPHFPEESNKNRHRDDSDFTRYDTQSSSYSSSYDSSSCSDSTSSSSSCSE